MSRIGRFVSKYETSVYHVISRPALPGLPMEDTDKDRLLHLIKYYSSIFFVDVLGFAIMGNHLHLVCRTYPESEISDEEVIARYKIYRGEDERPSRDNIINIRDRQLIDKNLPTCYLFSINSIQTKGANHGQNRSVCKQI